MDVDAVVVVGVVVLVVTVVAVVFEVSVGVVSLVRGNDEPMEAS